MDESTSSLVQSVLVTGAGIVLGTAIAAAAGSMQSESADTEKQAGSSDHLKVQVDTHTPEEVLAAYRFAKDYDGPVMVVEHKKYM